MCKFTFIIDPFLGFLWDSKKKLPRILFQSACKNLRNGSLWNKYGSVIIFNFNLQHYLNFVGNFKSEVFNIIGTYFKNFTSNVPLYKIT